MNDPSRLAELIEANARRRDSKREHEIQFLLKQLESTQRLTVLRSMLDRSVGGTYDLAMSLLSGEEAVAFFGGLVTASDASSLEYALNYGEKKLKPSVLVDELRKLMVARPELLNPLKYWRPELWERVAADNELLQKLSSARFARTRR